MCGVPYWVVFLFCVLPISTAEQHEESPISKVITGVVDRCINRESWDECLENEAAIVLGRALNLDTIPLAPGITLQRSSDTIKPKAKAITLNSSNNKTAFDEFSENIRSFLSTRSLTIKLGGFEEEGRGKKKKLFKYVGVALATAALILVPIKLKLIAWMAASALMIGKIALILASLAGLKSLVSKPQEETTHVHYAGHRNDQGHLLAYGGQDIPPGNSIEY